MNIAVLIYDLVELLDMNGPIDAFLHANRYNGGRYHVYTVAQENKAVVSEGGVVKITPEFTIENCPNPDVIIIPGVLTANYEADPVIINWIKKMGKKRKHIMSVCIGAYSLAKTGLLDGKNATTHYQFLEEIQQDYPDIHFVKNERYVEDGRIVSTGGITSGIDGALFLIEKFDGAVIAQQVADVMVYNREAALPPYTLLPPY